MPQYTGTATVSIAGGPAGADIGGTLSVPIQNGTASFSELTLSQAGSYILEVSAAGLTPALTSAIMNTSQESGGGGGSPPPPPAGATDDHRRAGSRHGPRQEGQADRFLTHVQHGSQRRSADRHKLLGCCPGQERPEARLAGCSDPGHL